MHRAAVVQRVRFRGGDGAATGADGEERRRGHRPARGGRRTRGPAAARDERAAADRRHRGRANRGLRHGAAGQRGDHQAPVVRVTPHRTSRAVREHVQERGRRFYYRKGS